MVNPGNAYGGLVNGRPPEGLSDYYGDRKGLLDLLSNLTILSNHS